MEVHRVEKIVHYSPRKSGANFLECRALALVLALALFNYLSDHLQNRSFFGQLVSLRLEAHVLLRYDTVVV